MTDEKTATLRRIQLPKEHADALNWQPVAPSNAVLLARLPSGGMGMRNREHPEVTLFYTSQEWDAFVSGVRAGEFDDMIQSAETASAHVTKLNAVNLLPLLARLGILLTALLAVWGGISAYRLAVRAVTSVNAATKLGRVLPRHRRDGSHQS
jgi:hypothetical protein